MEPLTIFPSGSNRCGVARWVRVNSGDRIRAFSSYWLHTLEGNDRPLKYIGFDGQRKAPKCATAFILMILPTFIRCQLRETGDSIKPRIINVSGGRVGSRFPSGRCSDWCPRAMGRAHGLFRTPCQERFDIPWMVLDPPPRPKTPGIGHPCAHRNPSSKKSLAMPRRILPGWILLRHSEPHNPQPSSDTASLNRFIRLIKAHGHFRTHRANRPPGLVPREPSPLALIAGMAPYFHCVPFPISPLWILAGIRISAFFWEVLPPALRPWSSTSSLRMGWP